jgi:drug/metabolite transporter (DMT)-like permease
MAALLWGSSATAAKSFFQHDISPLLVVESRVIIAAVVLTMFLLITRPQMLKVKLVDLKDFALLGIIGVAGSNYTYYAAIKETSVAIAILMQYTAPVLVALYMVVTRQEKISRIKTAAIILSLVGCTIMLGVFDNDVRITSLGIVLGILSAFCFAFFNIYAKVANKHYSIWTLITYTVISASIFWIVFDCVVNTGIRLSGGSELLTLSLFSFMSILLPYVFYFRGLKILKPSTAIVVSTLEPVVAIVTAFIFLGETLQLVQIAGGVFVVGAVILLEVYKE